MCSVVVSARLSHHSKFDSAIADNCSTWDQGTPDDSTAGIAFKNIPPEFNVLPSTTYGIARSASREIQVVFSDLFRGRIVGNPSSGYSNTGALIQFIWPGSQEMNKLINSVAVSMTNSPCTRAP